MYAMRNISKAEQTAHPSKYPQGYFKTKHCKRCQALFTPKAPSEMYCSDHCKDYAMVSSYLTRSYNITLDDYWCMLRAQNHTCAICGGEGFIMNKDKHKLKLVVDHCHTTGKVRGLLCHNCNRALGLLKDDVVIMNKAVEYLNV